MMKVSFYSYKGGSGRSTTLWNTVQRLIELMKPTRQEPFVIVDADTESAGSTFLFGAKSMFIRDGRYASVQRRMIKRDDTNYAASPETKERFFDRMYPIGKKMFDLEDDRAVLFIGANTDRNYSAEIGVDTTGKDITQLKNFTQNITKACEACGTKALFFDTPSGTQALAMHSIRDSDIIVCCMRPTKQFIEGTLGQLIDLVTNDKKTGIPKKYILTPTAVCLDKDQKFDNFEYPLQALKVIKIEFSAEGTMDEDEEIKGAFKENVKLDMLSATPQECKLYPNPEGDLIFGIPEVKRFKWSERCLGCIEPDRLIPNDKIALNRYNYLAKTIKKYS